MSEALSQKIELEDIVAPHLRTGDTSIIFQRHGKYNRDPSAADAGSISQESAQQMRAHDKAFFKEVLKQDDVYILFVSSDTQYAGNGYRSLETAQVAQDAATDVLVEQGMDPRERILNVHPDFKIAKHSETDSAIRPLAGIREPQIFSPEDKAYITYLQENYGYADAQTRSGISPQAWAVHEMDAASKIRETTGAESQDELIDRTDASLALLERYASVWHTNNPGKRLVIWAASHYDTISPLVKNVNGTLRDAKGSLTDAYQPVEYGGGVVIKIPGDEKSGNTLEKRGSSKAISFGHVATRRSVSRLHQSQQ